MAGGDARREALIALATRVTERPWDVTRDSVLSDEEFVHAVALSAFFGHLNRIADVVGVPLDYQVKHPPRPVDPAAPALPTATQRIASHADLSIRPATQAAIATWKAHAYERDAPLTRSQRAFVKATVESWLAGGDAPPPATEVELALRDAAELVTLAPWRYTPHSFDALRALGFDDAAIFDACATASATGAFTRIDVALSSR